MVNANNVRLMCGQVCMLLFAQVISGLCTDLSTIYVSNFNMTMVRCDCCTGKKTIIGLGNIAKKCHVCKGMGFKECDDIKADLVVSDCHQLEAKASLIVSDDTLDLVSNKNNDSLSPLEQKKIDQSARAKAMWAKRKAEQAGK